MRKLSKCKLYYLIIKPYEAVCQSHTTGPLSNYAGYEDYLNII